VQFLFDHHTLDADRRELHRGDERIAVEPQVFDLLVHLVQNRDRVVSKDDLIASVWGGRVVSDSTLTSRINAARKAIGDSGGDQKLIRTVPRKGLRFVATVLTQANAVEPGEATGSTPDEIQGPSRPALPLPDRPAIAVLTNMSGDPEQEYFSDGISDDIITALSKLRWFFVIAHNSSFIYKGKAVHMKQVAEELGVGYVVEGSVRKGGVRITAQLNDVATGSHLWAERYDRGLADVFAVQDEITEAIVAAIEPQLYAAENFRVQRKPPDSLDAWDLVMRALSHYWRVTRQDNVVAQALLERRSPSTRTTARRSASSPPAERSAPTWAGRIWPRQHRSRSARRWRRYGPTARTPGRTARWAASTCWQGGSTTRSRSSSWRCGSTRISRWPRAITA
jgi:TolB-like protein